MKEDIVKAVAVAQAVALVRKLTRDNAPQAVQMHAVATLSSKLAPYARAGYTAELVVLMLNVAEAQEEIRKASTIPNTIEELEDHFKRLDDAAD